MKLSKKNSFLLAFALLLFFVDVLFLGFFERHLIKSLLCLYAIVLSSKESASLLFSILFLLALYPFVVHGVFGLSLVYLIPLSIIFLHAKNLFQRTTLMPYIFLGSVLTANELVMKQYVLQVGFSHHFSLLTISVNLILLIFEKLLSQR